MDFNQFIKSAVRFLVFAIPLSVGICLFKSSAFGERQGIISLYLMILAFSIKYIIDYNELAINYQKQIKSQKEIYEEHIASLRYRANIDTRNHDLIRESLETFGKQLRELNERNSN